MKIEIEVTSMVGQIGEFRSTKESDKESLIKYLKELIKYGEESEFIYSHGGLGDGNFLTKDGFLPSQFKVL